MKYATRGSLVIFLAIALVFAPPAVAPVAAAPGQPVPSVAIDLVVELVTPEILKVTLRYTCLPSPRAVGVVNVLVTQSVPQQAAAVGGAQLTCDGEPQDVEIEVFGGPAFAPGDALAFAQACTVATCGTDSRKVFIRD